MLRSQTEQKGERELSIRLCLWLRTTDAMNSYLIFLLQRRLCQNEQPSPMSPIDISASLQLLCWAFCQENEKITNTGTNT